MEMEWGAIRGNSKSEQTPFLTLEPGENRVRIVSKPFKINIHWEKSVLDGRTKRVICPGAGCPICKANHIPMQRFQVLAINRKSNKVEILEGGTSIFSAVRGLAVDPDYGDPTQYDIKIKKEGTGRETKYSVMPSPRPTPLTAEEVKMVDENRSLTDISKPHTVEDIMGMGLEALADSTSDLAKDDDDWGTSSKPAGSSADLDDDEWNSL